MIEIREPARPRKFEEVFSHQPETVRAVAHKLRQLVAKTFPELTEAAYGGAKVRLVLYSFSQLNNVICGIQPGANGCLFYLHHVAQEDSATLKIEGKGKHARHIKITTLDEVTKAEISRLVALARGRAA